MLIPDLTVCNECHGEGYTEEGKCGDCCGSGLVEEVEE